MERMKSIFVCIGAVSSLLVVVGLILLVWGTTSGKFVNWLDSQVEYVIEAELSPAGTIGTEIAGVERLEAKKIASVEQQVKALQQATATLQQTTTTIVREIAKIKAQLAVVSKELGVDVSTLEADAAQFQADVARLQGEISTDAGQSAAALAASAEQSKSAVSAICDYIVTTARRKKNIPAECASFQ